MLLRLMQKCGQRHFYLNKINACRFKQYCHYPFYILCFCEYFFLGCWVKYIDCAPFTLQSSDATVKDDSLVCPNWRKRLTRPSQSSTWRLSVPSGSHFPCHPDPWLHSVLEHPVLFIYTWLNACPWFFLCVKIKKTTCFHIAKKFILQKSFHSI